MRKEELIVGERYKYKRVTRDEKTKEQVVKQKIMKLVAKLLLFCSIRHRSRKEDLLIILGNQQKTE